MIGKSRILLILAAAALTYLSLTALVGARDYDRRGPWSDSHCHESRWHPDERPERR